MREKPTVCWRASCSLDITLVFLKVADKFMLTNTEVVCNCNYDAILVSNEIHIDVSKCATFSSF